MIAYPLRVVRSPYGGEERDAERPRRPRRIDPTIPTATSPTTPGQNQAGAAVEPPDPWIGPLGFEGVEADPTVRLSRAWEPAPRESFTHTSIAWLPPEAKVCKGEGTELPEPSSNFQEYRYGGVPPVTFPYKAAGWPADGARGDAATLRVGRGWMT